LAQPTKVEAAWANQYPSVVDNDPTFLTRSYVEVVTAAADDTEINSVPGFNFNSTNLLAGDDGTLTWAWSTRFVIPAPSFPTVPTTVIQAFYTFVCDENDAGAILQVRAERSASPTPPTSYADFNARTRTTAVANWTPGTVVSGTQYMSADFSNVIQELINAYGSTITAIQLFVTNNASPNSAKLSIRSFENVANQPPQLTVRYQI
jgi:hypothetical protein